MNGKLPKFSIPTKSLPEDLSKSINEFIIKLTHIRKDGTIRTMKAIIELD